MNTSRWSFPRKRESRNLNCWTLAFAGVTLLLLIVGCKSPFDRTKDASGGGALGGFVPHGTMVIFSSELQTGGGAFEFPGGENQVLSFSDTSNPVSARSIRYMWNGQNVSSTFGPEHTFAGFDLMHVVDNTPTLSIYNSTPGRNLTAAGYGHATFFARGTLSSLTFVKVEIAQPSNPVPCISLSTDGTLDDTANPCGRKGVLAESWGTYSLPLVAANLASIKDFFKATIIFNEPTGSNIPGSGGTVYFDQILYAP